MKEPIVRKHTRQMEMQEIPKSSFMKVRCGLIEGDLLSAELTVLLLLLSLIVFGRSRAIELPLIYSVLTLEDVEDGL